MKRWHLFVFTNTGNEFHCGTPVKGPAYRTKKEAEEDAKKLNRCTKHIYVVMEMPE